MTFESEHRQDTAIPAPGCRGHFGPTIRHPEPTGAMTDDGIPAHKFGRRFGDKSS